MQFKLKVGLPKEQKPIKKRKMDDKDVNNKYDRQVRLWNPNGQQCLMRSKICLINATTEACETLKNLVLPGVSDITIVDDSIVTDDDLSSNFFILNDDLNKSKSNAVAKHLNELNPDVKVYPESKKLKELIDDEEYWKFFNCVISCSFFDKEFDTLVDILWNLEIPLVNLNSIGFYGSLRIYYPEQTIIETHDNNLEDLRIDLPWKDLQDYVDSIDLNDLSDSEFSDLPYSVILIKLFKKLKANNIDGKRPTVKEIRTQIKQLQNSKDDEINLDESYQKATQVMKNSNELPDQIEAILRDSNLSDINLSTSMFWIYVKALKNFYELHGCLPLSGVLPDMTSSTKHYITLQKIYRNKHESDKNEITKLVFEIMDSIGKSRDELNEQDISIFVKNCKFMQVHKGSKEKFNSSVLTENDYSPTILNNINIYIAILSFENFYRENNRHPTSKNLSELRTIAISLLCQYNNISTFPDGLELILDELLRSEGCKLHNICSLMGGLAAQEVIKILTNQYITLDNCLTFDGIKCHSASWKI